MVAFFPLYRQEISTISCADAGLKRCTNRNPKARFSGSIYLLTPSLPHSCSRGENGFFLIAKCDCKAIGEKERGGRINAPVYFPLCIFQSCPCPGWPPQPHSRSSAGAASGLMDGAGLARITREIEPHVQHSNHNVPVKTREQPMAALCCREKATWDNHRDCLTLLLSHTRHSGKVPNYT